MGNLIVNKQGKLRLPKISTSKNLIEVIIRLPDHKALDKEKQQQIFKLFTTYWQQAGIRFKLHEMGVQERTNEIASERFTQDVEMRTGKKQPPYKRNILQEQYFYIDLTCTIGTSYQKTWQSPLRKSTSAYVAINLKRRLFQEDILHEVGHALGLAHEHQRLDRNEHVEPFSKQQYSNDLSNGEQIDCHPSQFPFQSVPFGPYDPDSIMHYPGVFVDINSSQPIGGTPEKPKFPKQLSAGDIYAARFLYNEARIRKHLDNQINLQYGRTTKEMISEAKKTQSERQCILRPPYSHAECVKIRTFEVVKGQLEQLNKLNIPIKDLDRNLYQWAEHHRNNVQQQRPSTSSSSSVTRLQDEGVTNYSSPEPGGCCST